MSTFELTAKTLQGLEEVLAKEIESLGGGDIRISPRAVTFESSLETMYRVNYLCRTALHVLRPLKKFTIETQQDLYDAVIDVPWEKIFGVDDTICVDSICFDSVFTHSFLRMSISMRISGLSVFT